MRKRNLIRNSHWVNLNKIWKEVLVYHAERVKVALMIMQQIIINPNNISREIIIKLII